MYRIVIVDNDKAQLGVLKKLVSKAPGCQPQAFSDAMEALTWCRENEPDVVIVDYALEGMNGLQFLRAFRAMYSRDAVPMLIMTAAGDSQVRFEALKDGANDYLTKPFDNLEFSVRTRNQLTARQYHRTMLERNAWLEQEVAKATREIHERERETLSRVSMAAEFRDPETGAHIQRMAQYSRLIAKSLGLPSIEQALIADAAPLHDVGKIGIPDAILLKPGKLTAQEFEVMKQHASFGHELLSGSASPVVQTGAVIALTHHEKFDGSGYPGGLAGQDIPLHGRIVAVADVFDALTSERPYKKAWTLDRAVTHLREGARTHFDPHCVAAFLDSWRNVLEIREEFSDQER
jgi:putative two-component system response regulator